MTCLGGTAITAQPARKSVIAHLGGGYVESFDSLGDLFDPGWALYGGATFRPEAMGRFGIRLDLGASYFDVKEQEVTSATYPRILQVEEGYRMITSLSAAIHLELGRGGRFGGYVLGGLGAYSQYVTTTATVIFGDIKCDPVSGVCISFGNGDPFHETDRLTKLGYNLGAGMTIAAGSTREVYVEAQYRRMRYNEGTDFVPVVVGLRW